MNRWWISHSKMVNHDVNSDEWDEEGRPKNISEQLKPMW